MNNATPWVDEPETRLEKYKRILAPSAMVALWEWPDPPPGPTRDRDKDFAEFDAWRRSQDRFVTTTFDEWLERKYGPKPQSTPRGYCFGRPVWLLRVHVEPREGVYGAGYLIDVGPDDTHQASPFDLTGDPPEGWRTDEGKLSYCTHFQLIEPVTHKGQLVKAVPCG